MRGLAHWRLPWLVSYGVPAGSLPSHLGLKAGRRNARVVVGVLAQSVCDVAADTTGAQARVALANAADGAVLCRHDLVLHDRHGQWFRRQRDLVAVHRSGLGHRHVQPVS